MSAGFGAVGAAISIGVAMAFNEIDNDVNASIRDVGTSVQSTVGAISIEARDSSTIRSRTAAASAAIGGGAVGVALSGAGANATNVILNDNECVCFRSSLIAKTDLNVTAARQSIVNSTVDVISVALAGGAYAGGLSIGAAEANNYIGYDSSGTKTASNVKAYITGSNALVADELNQSATTSASVTTEVIADQPLAAAGPLGALAADRKWRQHCESNWPTVHSYVTNSTGNGVLRMRDRSQRRQFHH